MSTKLIERYGAGIAPYLRLCKDYDEFIYDGKRLSFFPNERVIDLDTFKTYTVEISTITFEFDNLPMTYVGKIKGFNENIESLTACDEIYNKLSQYMQFNIVCYHVIVEWYFETFFELVFENEEDMLTAALVLNA
ncbi:hypothetical protein FDI40_gp280 [Agrobacterium phage Atu_ph07]|uniref:Uncharacterized protein n=1 Tax=Agrobacterium phage Atu_ph07 TaxID=2024264 RepID=A0A2L0UZQ5_9CAUD|nr:hypothetical protein FDI40_gp280 [Agrobacterium phage Atu_ph07]AUZ95052.1 hypothetical protein [Agrobacterium phage Atu_ph07]